MREQNVKHIIDYLKPYYHKEFIFGLLGNIKVETANTFDPATVQKGKGFTNEFYLEAIRTGTTNFVSDKCGFGLVQWTSAGRKERLMNFSSQNGKSLDDFDNQLEYIRFEITQTGYANVRMAIRDEWNLEDCTRIICTEYERPRSMQMDATTKENAIQNRISVAKALWEEFGAYYDGKGETMKSPLTDITMLSPNHSGKRKYNLTRLTPHCTAVMVTAKRIGEIFQNPSRNASCNYGIGTDLKIVCCVEEENRSWCSSSPDNDNRAITFECASSNTAPYEFAPGVYDRLVDLCIDICKRYNRDTLLWISDKKTALAYVPKDNELVLTVHRWFAAKACPGDWMMARMGELASRVTSALKPSTGTTEYIEYVVKRGDTLTKIAKAYNVTVDDIVAVNPQITNPSKISVGQVIKIPIVGRDIPAYHTVNKEDGLNSLSKIAKRYGISLAQIKELNPQVKAPLYIIHNGDKIRIK